MANSYVFTCTQPFITLACSRTCISQRRPSGALTLQFPPGPYTHTADPAVFIATTVVYVLEGDSVSIEAGIYFSSASEVQWFIGGQLLNIASNPQLSQTIEGDVYTLNIANINSQLVGLYTVLVTRDGGQTASDNVTVSYACECYSRLRHSNTYIHTGLEH